MRLPKKSETPSMNDIERGFRQGWAGSWAPFAVLGRLIVGKSHSKTAMATTGALVATVILALAMIVTLLVR